VLGASGRALVAAYDLVMLDLDGVVYIGDAAVEGAPHHLEKARGAGAHLAFVTNNASRPPRAVAEKLAGLGVGASDHDVVTSAQAAAHVLLERHGSGSPIAVLGAAGLREALVEAGLRPVAVSDETAVGIVTGFGSDVVWGEVMLAASRIREGLPWVASNTDLTLPTPTGTTPGHGALVALIERFAEVTPTVAGKPSPPLLEETIRRVGGERPLMVGDRLDTDIDGAHRAGVDSLLVLTGVTGLVDLVAAGPALRPTYVACDLGGLLEEHLAPRKDRAGWTAGGWSATVTDGRLVLTGGGEPADWWRAMVCAAWEHLDTAGDAAGVEGLVPPDVPSGR
jgi:HAD superfamily hydrolase (TIGR01450 family)